MPTSTFVSNGRNLRYEVSDALEHSPEDFQSAPGKGGGEILQRNAYRHVDEYSMRIEQFVLLRGHDRSAYRVLWNAEILAKPKDLNCMPKKRGPSQKGP